MKILFVILLSSAFAPVISAFNIGYLSTDYGFPVSVDKFQWEELEEKGRTVLQYQLKGPVVPGNWVGVSLVAIERDHLPKLCLERIRFEFSEGVEELDLFVMKIDRTKKLLRISTTDQPAFTITNSIFILEYNGLYRKYGGNYIQKARRPFLRSERIQNQIDLLLMNLDSNQFTTRRRIEKLLQTETDAIIRPLSWEEIKTHR